LLPYRTSAESRAVAHYKGVAAAPRSRSPRLNEGPPGPRWAGGREGGKAPIPESAFREALSCFREGPA
jgi:hypothetical protein